MRAVLLALGDEASVADGREGAPLRPVLDRPLLQHAVERLVVWGIKQFDVVACVAPERVEALLGDGRRWGIQVRFHLARDAGRPFEVLRRLDLGHAAEDCVLGMADRLPMLDEHPLAADSLLCQDSAGQPAWTGWAVLSPRALASIPPRADEQAAFEALRALLGDAACVESPVLLDARTEADLLQANLLALQDGWGASSRRARPGVWIGRGSVVHPTARVVPPVYIGQETMIGAGVVLGPDAVVGSGCMVDDQAHVEESVIAEGTWIGQSLEVREAVVSGRRLYHAGLDTVVDLDDPSLLADLRASEWRDRLEDWGWRCVGAALTVALLPAVAWARHGERDGAGVRRLLRRLPDVAKGEVRLVGLPERSESERAHLPAEWREVARRAPQGLVTPYETLVDEAPRLPVEAFTLEAWYASHRGPRQDVAMAVEYVRRRLGLRAWPARPVVGIQPVEGA